MKKRLLNRAIPVIAVPSLALAALLLTFLLLSRSAMSATPDGEDTVPKVRAQEGPFTVSGTIVCGATGPISDVEVYARTEGEDTVVLSDTTDSGGVYSLALEGGSYDLDFEPPLDAGLNARAFTTTAILTDTVIDVDFCVCSGAWITEIVDSAVNIGCTSLELESSHPYTPHISYWASYGVAPYSLKYAWLDSATWHSKTVDSGAGGEVSLALVPTAPYTPAISYGGDNRRLKFAWLSGTTWSSMTVPGLDKCCSSLALEPVDPYNPHISHFWKWGTERTLYHRYLSGTTWMSGEWQDEPVEPAGSEVGYASSLALEAAFPYRPRIAYYDHGRDDLKYAWLSGTIWFSETVDSVGNVGVFPSLALDSTGNPHISYLDMTNGTLKYAWKIDTIWFSGTVDSIGNLPYNAGRSLLKLDESDTVHISYYDAANGDLKYARFDGAVWIIQTIDSIGDVGTRSSLELDKCGCPHISYRDVTNGDLKYAYIANYGIYLPLVLRQFP